MAACDGPAPVIVTGCRLIGAERFRRRVASVPRRRTTWGAAIPITSAHDHGWLLHRAGLPAAGQIGGAERSITDFRANADLIPATPGICVSVLVRNSWYADRSFTTTRSM